MKQILFLAIAVSFFTSSGFAQLKMIEGKKPSKGPCTTLVNDLMNRAVTDTSPGRAVADDYKTWENGSVILVKFMNNVGSPALRERIMRYAREWEQYANITFRFVPDNTPVTNVRVKLGSRLDSLGHNSSVGIDCNNAPQYRQTLNLDTSDFLDYKYYENDLKTGGAFYQYLVKNGTDMSHYTYKRFYYDILFYADPNTHFVERYLKGTTLHEFGHALGLLHEQSYPGAINWNRDTIYQYYARFGWDKEKTDFNVLEESEQFFTNGTSYDPRSIMHYPVYAWQTLDGFTVDENNELSDGDKRIIAALYPRNQKVSSLAVPKVIISNFFKLEVINDKVRKALVIYPHFDVQTGAKLANAFYVARLTTEDGQYYIPTTNLKYNWGGSAATYLKMNLAPNTKKSYNKVAKDLQLILPYSQMPDMSGKNFKVEFTVYQDDVATGKLNRLVYYSYSYPMTVTK